VEARGAAIDALDLDIKDGEFMVVVGLSSDLCAPPVP
jgi:ABC-type sugar transport system ATPase subunit